MKRIVLSLFGAALLLMVTACDSGAGGGAGLPQDTTAVTPANVPHADMREQKIDLKKIKPQGPDPGPAATPEKKD
jgi:2-polyprenyl-3-methyl-5-hydroxy-6-metoxy-1,4-benzoquinol methylase